jgi:hypothetical protein
VTRWPEDPEAMLDLLAAGKVTLRELNDGLDFEQPEDVQVEACSWLGGWVIGDRNIGDRRSTVPRLVRLLRETSSKRVRDAAADALQHLGGRRACALLEPVLVDHPDASVRAAAARALSSGTNPPSGHEIECASILLCALTDEDPDVRAAAAFGIGNTARDRRLRRFVPGLLRALADPAAQVRAGACYALAYLGSEAEVPVLEALLDDRTVPAGDDNDVGYLRTSQSGASRGKRGAGAPSRGGFATPVCTDCGRPTRQRSTAWRPN